MPAPSETREREQIMRENSRSFNSMHVLFLALNDVAGFEREVLRTCANVAEDVQGRANSTRPEALEF